MQTLIITSTIFIFAIVQSVFGVGILVFGTPTLMLAGMSFPEALSWLLPASISVSICQVISGRYLLPNIFAANRVYFCLGPLVLTLVFVLVSGYEARIEWMLGITMLGIALLRQSERLRAWLSRFIKQYERWYLALMGIVHGATNMGGSLLSIYTAFKSENKYNVRTVTALYYLSFGLLQLAILSVLRPEIFGINNFLGPLIALIGYFVMGRVIFLKVTHKTYDVALTSLVALYGLAILTKANF